MRFPWDRTEFENVWNLHPESFEQIRMFGNSIAAPRWSKAYGQDYRYSGTLHRASPVPDMLMPLLAWSKVKVDERVNGVLVNWYDGSLGHKIGAHRDDEKELVVGAPIITISFGESRTFRLRRWRVKTFATSRWTTIACLFFPMSPTWTSLTRCQTSNGGPGDAFR
jgi:alkylated DNA repair dioxygenase AlkB